MKKLGVLLVLSLVLSLVIVSAAANDTYYDKAYSCLENKVSGKCSSLTSFEDQVFSLLALSYSSSIQSDCKTAVKAKSANSECWPSPSSSCKIKDTAQALLALNNINENTASPEAWLMKRNITPTDLEWYLEIDSLEATQCKIFYDDVEKATVNLDGNKKITSITDNGNCLTSAFSGYWLQIGKSNPACLRKKFSVTCNKDFSSTLLFKRSSSSTWFITSTLQQASANGKTEHQINSYCFSTSTTSCDYESNLWAAFALKKLNYDIQPVLPYLISFAEGNERFFPDSFILNLKGENLQNVLSLQKSDGSWKVDTNEYYDTAIALLSLSTSEENAIAKAKSWLETKQSNDGCWGGIRDTAFLLWSGFGRTPVTTPGTSNDCEVFQNHCVTSGECVDAGGNLLTSFSCAGHGAGKVCCDKEAALQTCSDLGGEECPSTQDCDQTPVDSLDASNSCCLGTCTNRVSNTCEQVAGNTCKSTSSSGENIVSTLECTGNQFCCTPKPTTQKSYWWLWLLIILIILLVVGIIFRNRLRVFAFRFKGHQGPVNKTRPGFPPAGPPMAMRRPIPFPQRQPYPSSAPRQTSKSDNELEETLRKLKDMSK